MVSKSPSFWARSMIKCEGAPEHCGQHSLDCLLADSPVELPPSADHKGIAVTTISAQFPLIGVVFQMALRLELAAYVEVFGRRFLLRDRRAKVALRPRAACLEGSFVLPVVVDGPCPSGGSPRAWSRPTTRTLSPREMRIGSSAEIRCSTSP
jgi:hypothetical protein